MNTAVITGISGFVGAHLERHLLELGWQVYGFDQRITDDRINIYKGDLADRDVFKVMLKECRPDVVFHLAGLIKSNRPELLYQANVIGTVALFESLVEVDQHPAVVVSSSSAVYGAGPGIKSITERFRTHPMTHYAVSKLTQELAALRYFSAFQFQVMIVRMFNVIGAGQSADLACSSFARQIALAEARDHHEIITGDLNARRDFVDVRDAVRAFAMVAEKGKTGQVYNVCSGRAVLMRKCLDKMLSMSPRQFQVRMEAERVQKDDIPVQVGSAKKLTQATGWHPQISLKQSLSDLLEYWRQRVKSGLE